MLIRLTVFLVALYSPAAAQVFLPGDIVQSPSVLAAQVLDSFQYISEGHPTANVTITQNDGLLQVVVEDGGYLDDSVAGGRSIYTLTPLLDGGWEVVTASFMQRCRRGENRGWTTSACP